jgi:hypothetical protein
MEVVMRPFFPWVVLIGTVLVGAAGVAVLGVLALSFGRPPQPLALGTMQWISEVGATVDAVDRVDHIGPLHARGVFYIVHARIIAPFGFRPTWHDTDVEVRTFSGHGGTMHDLRFAVAAEAQAELDKRTGRPGPVHLVRGATQHEDLVFDLPADVEQPGLVFLPANDPTGLIAWIFGVPWQPHRFNLRFD